MSLTASIPQKWLEEIEAGTEFGKRAQAAIAKMSSSRSAKGVSHQKKEPAEPVGYMLEKRISGLLKIKTNSTCR
jgi:hypothetical protein